MVRTKFNLVAPLAFAVLGITAVSIEPALAGVNVPAPLVGAGLPASSDSGRRILAYSQDSGAPLERRVCTKL